MLNVALRQILRVTFSMATQRFYRRNKQATLRNLAPLHNRSLIFLFYTRRRRRCLTITTLLLYLN
jgi:hypothetical protein